MASKDKPTTSWADETDDFEETERERKPTNAWANGNPLVTKQEKKESNEREQRRDDEEDYKRRKDQREDYDREEHGERRVREKRALPTSAPYTAFVGNLAWDIYPDEVQKFFEDAGCKVLSVRLAKDRTTGKPRGRGYVEFEDLESLKRALESDGQVLRGRDLKLDVAENKPESDRPRRDNHRDRNSRDRPRNNDRRRSPARDREHRDRSPARDEEPKERRKLELLPRASAPAPTIQTEPSPSEAYKTAKVNPFGDAKPRDENEILRKKEEERKAREHDSPKNGAEPEQKRDEKPRDERPREDKPRREQQPRRDDRVREDRPREDRPREDRPRDDRRREERRDDKPRGDRPRDDRRRDDRRRDDKSFRRDDKRDDKKREDRPRPAQKVEKAVEFKAKNIFDALADEQ